MKNFHLLRIEDETGVSGTGKVAEGVQFSDGTCVMRWLTQFRSTCYYDSMSDLVEIHGHHGKTQVHFEDQETREIWAAPEYLKMMSYNPSFSHTKERDGWIKFVETKE